MEPAFKKALQISASAHLIVLLAMVVNFNFFSKPEVVIVPLYSSSDAPLQATMIENPKLEQAEVATRRKEEPKKEEPKKEPPPEEDLIKKREEERKRQAEKELQVKRQQEAEAKKKKEQADLALKKKQEQEKLKKEQEKKKAEEKARLEKQRKAEEAKKKAEAERKKKIEEERKKKAEAQKRREELERAAEEQLMDDLAEEAEEARRAIRQGQLLTEKQRYVAMIVERVRQSWFTDDTMNGKECIISLRLASNGFVTSLTIEGGDPGVCKAAENAINRVGRFPMPDDPELNAEFRQLRLPFKK